MGSKQKVLIAMSGGVDSSVVAAIMKSRGHDVIGITMQIWQESQQDPRHAGCCSLGAVEDARRVARILDIPHYVVNMREEFRATVIENFIDEYGRGRTPNPCVQCNKWVKFDALLEKMNELGCNKLVTGHYARIRQDKKIGRYRLLRSRGGKDQSYVLYMLAQEQLSKVLFPLGELSGKTETRQIAAMYGLPVANKPDSQEICFVSEAGGYAEFIKKERPELFQEGELVSTDGETLGKHSGVASFTVGQRRGLGVSSREGRPLFVIQIQPAENRVVLGTDEALLKQEVELDEVVWSNMSSKSAPARVMGKIRYNMLPQLATIYPGRTTKLVFDQPVRAVTPGQIAVAYRGETVVVGGVIRG